MGDQKRLRRVVVADDDADIKMLRKRIATLVADALLPPKDTKERGPTE